MPDLQISWFLLIVSFKCVFSQFYHFCHQFILYIYIDPSSALRYSDNAAKCKVPYCPALGKSLWQSEFSLCDQYQCITNGQIRRLQFLCIFSSSMLWNKCFNIKWLEPDEKQLWYSCTVWKLIIYLICFRYAEFNGFEVGAPTIGYPLKLASLRDGTAGDGGMLYISHNAFATKDQDTGTNCAKTWALLLLKQELLSSLFTILKHICD